MRPEAPLAVNVRGWLFPLPRAAGPSGLTWSQVAAGSGSTCQFSDPLPSLDRVTICAGGFEPCAVSKVSEVGVRWMTGTGLMVRLAVTDGGLGSWADVGVQWPPTVPMD